MDRFIDLTGISKTFGGVTALSNVDLDIAPGEVHCLAGENGSGKSTLIKIISGVQKPERGGRIVIGGSDCTATLTPAESIRRGIQVIYQDLSLFPNLTVAENIAIERHRGGGLVDRKAIRETARVAADALGIRLDHDAYVADLPIAQRQLVAICRAIANEARLVIMDEPTASLTRQEVDSLLALTLELKRRGVAIVFVSHRLDEVLQVAERVTVLRNGVKRGTFDASEMDGRRLVELMTGKAFDYAPLPPPADAAPTVLSVSGLCRAGDYADVGLDVKAGEILGIIGRLGSGRTELALSLFGMTRPDSGDILIAGQPLAAASCQDAIASGIAYVPEDRLALGLVMDQSIASNITVPVLEELEGTARLVDGSRWSAMVSGWIGRLGIKVSDASLPVRTLSGGNQQRVVIAKWLATKPKLLILDSPTVGVDIAAKDGLYRIVENLAKEGLAVIMISDEIPEIFYHSHRILVMSGGRITAEFRPTETTETAVREALDA